MIGLTRFYRRPVGLSVVLAAGGTNPILSMIIVRGASSRIMETENMLAVQMEIVPLDWGPWYYES